MGPEQVRWFRWEALMTWLSGVALLFLVYYSSSGLIDPDVADISQGWGIAIGLAVLIGGWLVYDLALKSPLGKSEGGFAVFAILMIAAVSWGLLHVFSGRAAYIHVGAMMGTIMTLNVWMRILPAQRKMIAVAAEGGKFDASLGAQAKLLIEAKYVHGRACRFHYDQQSFSGGDLREYTQLGGAGCAGCGRVRGGGDYPQGLKFLVGEKQGCDTSSRQSWLRQKHGGTRLRCDAGGGTGGSAQGTGGGRNSDRRRDF